MHERLIASVKRACYAGLDSVTLRRTVAARAQRELGYDGYVFGTNDPDTGLVSHMVADGVPARMARDYVENFYPYEWARVDGEMVRSGRPVFSPIQLSTSLLDHVRNHGFAHDAHVVVATRGRIIGKWCMFHSRNGDELHAATLRVLSRLAPHLARGLRNAALLEHAKSAGTADSAPDVPGILTLDERNRPVLTTAALACQLRDLSDVGVTPRDGIPMPVRMLVAELRARTGSVNPPGELVIRTRGHSGRWYAVSAVIAEPDSSGSSHTVVIVKPLVRREVAPMLIGLYGLTPRESEIIAAIARGDSTRTIAASLGVSPHTVTEHVGRACEKIGVRGRKALVARLFFDGYYPALTGERAPALRAS